MSKYKLYSLAEAMSIATGLMDNGAVSFESIETAPKWLRVLSRGGYCVYGKTIYVPAVHLALVASKHVEDRNLATAKLLPYIMYLWQYPNLSVPISGTFKYFGSYRTQCQYFIYEYFYLKGTEYPHTALLTAAFFSTRRTWYFKRVPSEKVERFILGLFPSQKSSSS